MFTPALRPSGVIVLLRTPMVRRTARMSSVVSASSRSSRLALCAIGATMAWPGLYGNLFSITIAPCGRHTTSSASGSSGCSITPQNRHPGRCSPAMVQMGMCALLFSAGGTWSVRPPNGSVWFAIAVTGMFASAFGYFIQTWVQARISANRTALILVTEPAWALVAAVVLAGQRLGVLQAAGAALLLAAIVGHELASLKFEPHVEASPP